VDLYEGTTLNVTPKEFYSYPDYQEGKSVSLIYGLVYLGVNPADGHPLFQRANGNSFDGIKEKPNKEDFFVLGKSTPPYTGGWFHNLKYKNWNLSVNLFYSFGGKAVHTNRTRVTDIKDANKNLIAGQVGNTWFNVGDVNKIYPTVYAGTNNYSATHTEANTKNISSTDFIRVNDLTLRYNFDNQEMQKISKGLITNWGMYAQLTNIYTWTNFGGGDPESANLQGSAQPILTVGTNITF